MAGDHEIGVRLEVAQRLAPEQLVALRDDAGWQVRHAVAQRISRAQLEPLLNDADDTVRQAAEARRQAA